VARPTVKEGAVSVVDFQREISMSRDYYIQLVWSVFDFKTSSGVALGYPASSLPTFRFGTVDRSMSATRTDLGIR
jgi:hypothetical protein